MVMSKSNPLAGRMGVLELPQAQEERWDMFVCEYWEKRPVVLKSPFGDNFISAAQPVNWLRKAYEPGQSPLGREFFIKGIKQPSPSGDLLPLAGETTLEEFIQRLATQVGISDYQYVLYGLGRFDAQTMLSTRQAIWPLLQRIGLPSGALDTDCFFGDYKETAAGLHKDNAAVISYVVHGTKTMLVWPFDYFADKTEVQDAIRQKVRLGHVDFRPYMKDATELVAGPGDVMYWPSTYWHVSVGEGTPQMTFNISLYFPIQPRADVDEIIRLLAGPRLDKVWERFYSQQTGPEIALPESWQQVVNIYKEVLNSKKFEGMLLGSWMRRLSSGGYTTRPAPNPDWNATDDCLLLGDSGFPVLTAPVAGEKRIISACGTIFTADDMPWLDVLVKLVNEGKPFTLSQAVKRCAAGGHAAPLSLMRTVAERLLQCWALQKVTD